MAGDEVSLDVDEVEGCEDGFWKNLCMSILGFEGVAGTDTAGVEEDEGDVPAAVREDNEAFPLRWVLGRDPKDLTPSDLTWGAEAGEEEIGAETSSIEPNVTGEPGRRRVDTGEKRK